MVAHDAITSDGRGACHGAMAQTSPIPYDRAGNIEVLITAAPSMTIADAQLLF